MPLIALWILLGSNPISTETLSTHPASERRLLAILDYSFRQMEGDADFAKYLRENGLEKRWQRARAGSQDLAVELGRLALGSQGQQIPRTVLQFAGR